MKTHDLKSGRPFRAPAVGPSGSTHLLDDALLDIDEPMALSSTIHLVTIDLYQ